MEAALSARRLLGGAVAPLVQQFSFSRPPAASSSSSAAPPPAAAAEGTNIVAIYSDPLKPVRVSPN